MNPDIDRWMEPRLVSVLFVIAIIFVLAVRGGIPQGIGQDARMLLGAAGEAAQFVTHMVSEAENYFQRSATEDKEHLTYASLEPACATPTRSAPPLPAGISIINAREMKIPVVDVEALEARLNTYFERLDVAGWPHLEELDIEIMLGELPALHVVHPEGAPRVHVEKMDWPAMARSRG